MDEIEKKSAAISKSKSARKSKENSLGPTRREFVKGVAGASLAMAGSSLASIYPYILLEELISHAHDRAESAVKTATAILERAGKKVEAAHKMPVGDPRSLILDTTESWGADLIVLASHGRRGLDRFLMGSVSEAVATYAPCSVEVIRN